MEEEEDDFLLCPSSLFAALGACSDTPWCPLVILGVFFSVADHPYFGHFF